MARIAVIVLTDTRLTRKSRENSNRAWNCKRSKNVWWQAKTGIWRSRYKMDSGASGVKSNIQEL